MKTDNNLLVGKKNMSMRNFDPGGGTIAWSFTIDSGILMFLFKVNVMSYNQADISASIWYWIEIILMFYPRNLLTYGVILVKFVAATMNEHSSLVDDASSAPGKLQKSMLHCYLKGLFFGSLEKQWEVHTPWIWTEIFGNGILEIFSNMKKTVSMWAQK